MKRPGLNPSDFEFSCKPEGDNQKGGCVKIRKVNGCESDCVGDQSFSLAGEVSRMVDLDLSESVCLGRPGYFDLALMDPLQLQTECV